MNPRKAAEAEPTSGLSDRLARSLPPLRLALVGGLLWAAAMASSAWFDLWMQAWQTPAKIEAVMVLFAAGGAVAWPIALFFARFSSLGRPAETAFAALFFFLGAASVGVTALLYANQYRGYYSEWHAPAFTVTWGFQLVYTTLGALYQFALFGVRLLFPIGFAALLAASLWFARQPR